MKNKTETLSSIKQSVYSLCQRKFKINKEDANAKEFSKWMVRLCVANDPDCSTTNLKYREPWARGYYILLNTEQDGRANFVKKLLRMEY